MQHFETDDRISSNLYIQGGLSAQQVRNAAMELKKGLAWAAGLGDDLPQASIDENTLLRATKLLTPPNSGIIDSIEIGGKWVGSNISLNRGARARVSERLKRSSSAEPFVFHGLLEAADVGKLTCTLRYTRDGEDRKCTFTEEISEEVEALFNTRVTVIGYTRLNNNEIATIVPEVVERHVPPVTP